jgi:hypothetical protein
MATLVANASEIQKSRHQINDLGHFYPVLVVGGGAVIFTKDIEFTSDNDRTEGCGAISSEQSHT